MWLVGWFSLDLWEGTTKDLWDEDDDAEIGLGLGYDAEIDVRMKRQESKS